MHSDAASALGNIGRAATEDIPALIQLRTDYEEDIRVAASHSIKRIQAAPDQAV